MQRDGRIDNQAVSHNDEADVAARQRLADEIGTPFKRDVTAARNFA